MSTDFSDTATAVEEVAVGAAQAAAEVATDPIGAARKQARSFERKGTPAVRRINRRLNALMPERVTVFGVEVNEKLPEKLAIKGLQLVKVQARREDVVGGVAKRTLRIFNGSFKTIARTATRLEQASELAPRRVRERRPAARGARRRTGRRRAASTERFGTGALRGAFLFRLAFPRTANSGSLHRLDRVRLHPHLQGQVPGPHPSRQNAHPQPELPGRRSPEAKGWRGRQLCLQPLAAGPSSRGARHGGHGRNGLSRLADRARSRLPGAPPSRRRDERHRFHHDRYG